MSYEESMRNFSKNLYDLRKYTKRTQNELGKRCGLTQGYICQLEKGNMYPSINAMEDIAKSFGITIRQLVGMDKIQWCLVW